VTAKIVNVEVTLGDFRDIPNIVKVTTETRRCFRKDATAWIDASR